jgi:hypothetical protein
MYSLLLKKAVPFALTFVLGSLVGGLFKLAGTRGQTAAPARSYYYNFGEGHSCRARMRARTLVAETKPLLITFKPDARLPYGLKSDGLESLLVRVTFGADGKIQDVEHVDAKPGTCQTAWMESVTHKWGAVSTAARQIQFEPEMVNGLPVTVTREVEIRFMAD